MLIMFHTAAGINSSNVLHCLWGSVSSTGHQLDGVAVVSDIMASTDPFAASQRLSRFIQAFYRSSLHTFSLGPSALTSADTYTVEGIKTAVGTILHAVKKFSPLVHQVLKPARPHYLSRRQSKMQLAHRLLYFIFVLGCRRSRTTS